MSYKVPMQVNAGVFRTYDIRGLVGEDSIHPDLAYAIGLAFGSMSLQQQQRCVMVGRDGRLTSSSLQQALIAGLCDSGCNAVDIGLVSTPILYFATHEFESRTGIMVTASHNPSEDNGFKLVLNGNTLSSEGVQEVYQRIINKNFQFGSGEVETRDVTSAYIDCVCQKITLDRPLKLVVDYGNGVGAVAGGEIFRRLGCQVVELYEQIDGRFPNHHPDPTVPKNLVDIKRVVQTEQADLGLAFDGDADRIGVITNDSEVIWPDRQMILYALDLLKRQKGAQIIFDVKCTNHLASMIERHGGKPIMYKTGHSLIKAKMKEINAPLAGEMSGHIFFNDDWFGFDDGVYVACRLLQILAAQELTCAQLFQALPDSVNTPELKLSMAEDAKSEFMSRLLEEADFGIADRITIDGLRVDFGFGWGLIRPSNTSAYLIIRFEADSEANLANIQAIFREQLLKLDGSLDLPF